MNHGKIAFAWLLLATTLIAAFVMFPPAHAGVGASFTSTADTQIRSGTGATYNYGGCTSLAVQSDSTVGDYRSLVKFDLSSIPAGSVVYGASLTVTFYGYTNPPTPFGRTYTANRVTTNWVEGTECPSVGGGATWNTVDGTTNWGTPGGDFTATGAASTTVPDYSVSHLIVWDVTTIVKAWIQGGQQNYGFLIKDSSEGSTGYETLFFPREVATASVRPVLTLAYVGLTASPASVTVAAGGSGSTTITVHSTAGSLSNPVIGCSGLPTGATCSTTPNPLSSPANDGYQFTLTVSASATTAPGTYPVMVQLTSYSLPTIIQPGFLATSPIVFTHAGGGGIGPSSISIQQAAPQPSVTITLVVNAAVIPEYPLGLPLLAIFMVIGYGLIRRRTSAKS